MIPEGFDRLKKFYNHRLALNHGDDSSKETPEYWNNQAEQYSLKSHSQKERTKIESILNRFTWEKGETVLDVASGPGTFSIPLAKRGCFVTATDFSSEMLNQLTKQSQKEKTSEIKCIQSRWLEENIENQFDTVICMSGLGVIATDSEHSTDLGKALEKLYVKAKKRLIVLIPHADSILNEEIKKIIGFNETPIERLRIALIYYAMIDHGMLPSLEIINNPNKLTFHNIAEASKIIQKKAGITDLSDKANNLLEEYLETSLEKESNGDFVYTYNVKQALFTILK